MKKIDLKKKLARINDLWSPKIIASLNGQNVLLAKGKGSFVWHSHSEQDEFFLVLEGTLTIKLAGAADVSLNAGQAFVVPKGVRHKTVCDVNTSVLLFEPEDTKHTGERKTGKTVARFGRI